MRQQRFVRIGSLVALILCGLGAPSWAFHGNDSTIIHVCDPDLKFICAKLNASNGLKIEIIDANGDAALVDASGNLMVSLGTALQGADDAVQAWRYGYNGTAFEETQHNLDLTLLASAARTATTTSTDQTNRNGKGVLVTVDVTSITSTPILTPSIQCKDVLSGKYESLLTASATITATGTHTYVVYPGVGAASGDVAQTAGFPLCRTWRVSIAHTDSDSATYSVGASLAQ